MAKYKISISFKRKYHDVYLYLNHLKENNENISDYICKLVDADMNKDQEINAVTQEEIRQIVLETLMIGNHSLQQAPITQPPTTNKDKLSKDDNNLLNDLF